jgi:hypothetical protein
MSSRHVHLSVSRRSVSSEHYGQSWLTNRTCCLVSSSRLFATQTLTDSFPQLDSYTSSLSATPWVKDQWLSSTLPRCSQLFSESKVWLGPSASTTPLVRILDLSIETSLTKSSSWYSQFDIPSNADRHDSDWRLWVDS